MADAPPPDGWFNWITSLLGALTALGTALMWLLRRIVLGFVQDEFERKHKENKEKLDGIHKLLTNGARERKEMQNDVSFLKDRVNELWRDYHEFAARRIRAKRSEADLEGKGDGI